MRLDGWTQMATQTYDLDESQQALVRNELEAMQTERREEMGPDADEYDRLGDAMGDLWSKHEKEKAGGGSDWWGVQQRMMSDPEFTELRKRMRELEEKYPFDMEAAVQRLEKLLPEEQAEKGRARREKWRERMGRWRQRRENQSDESKGGEQAEEQPVPTPEQKAADKKSTASAQEAGTKRQAAVDAGRVVELTEEQAARELHPWEKYVRDFVRHHRLTETQALAAMSILKNVLNRAEQIERVNADKAGELEKITDKSAREARRKELDKPIDQLFEELKRRLDGLLTAAQRAERPTSRPIDSPNERTSTDRASRALRPSRR